MVKIIEKINHILANGSSSDPFFSFEFFPPKTESGVENLYLRMDRMTVLQPLFVDITWGAGGSTRDLTLAISEYSQTYFGVETLMHLTCTNMTVPDLKQILVAAKEAGIQNILALRGDPPRGAVTWEAVPDGLDNAIDLVKLIRKEHGDYFGIAVAGFPEGHPQSRGSSEEDIAFLKQKVDAGADFILTNFFYDPSVFLDYIENCRRVGISCPIVPGMMPIQSFSSFKRMTSFCRTRVPDYVWLDLAPISGDDEAVKAYGVQLCVKMCKTLASAGVPGFHFYTLNLEKSVLNVLKDLGIEESTVLRRVLPWRGSRANLKGMAEDVRPINWANRPKSYIKRTVQWDEFPNGRWGDGRSPAFGELSDSHFFRPAQGSREDRLAMWGEAPISVEDIHEVFAAYVEHRIPIIPWCETPLQAETGVICTTLVSMNKAGFMTINSQPALNAERSDHPDFGWGGSGGRVYQKAYVEFFVSQEDFKLVEHLLKTRYASLTLYAVDSAGKSYGCTDKGVTALTWGVFPNKEILQPTVFDADTFLVWSKEAFQLWTAAWASLYDDDSDSCRLIYDIHDTYLLVAIIDNDFVESSLYNAFIAMVQRKTDRVANTPGTSPSTTSLYLNHLGTSPVTVPKIPSKVIINGINCIEFGSADSLTVQQHLSPDSSGDVGDNVFGAPNFIE